MQVEIRTCDITSLVAIVGEFLELWSDICKPSSIVSSPTNKQIQKSHDLQVTLEPDSFSANADLYQICTVQLAPIHKISWRISTKISLSPSQPKIIHLFPSLMAFPKSGVNQTPSTIYLQNSPLSNRHSTAQLSTVRPRGRRLWINLRSRSNESKAGRCGEQGHVGEGKRMIILGGGKTLATQLRGELLLLEVPKSVPRARNFSKMLLFL